MKNWPILVLAAVALWICLSPQGVQEFISNIGLVANQTFNTFMPYVLVVLAVGWGFKVIFKKGGK